MRWHDASRAPGVIRNLAVILALCIAASTARADVSVQATVESNDVVVNQAFILTIVVEGAQNVSPPRVSSSEGFEVGYLGPSTQVSFVNGRMTASVSHRYRVVPLQPGEFQLGPFSVDVQGRRYQTEPLSIRVAAQAPPPRAAAAARGQAAGLKLVVSPAKTEAYVGERVGLTVTLYVGQMRVRDLQYPVIAADGVTLDKFGQPVEGSAVIEGQRYQTVVVRSTMTPVRPGPVDIDASMAMHVPVSRRRGDTFFDQFFGAETKPVEVHAETARLDVIPVPEAGRPASFSGAVGQFDFKVSAKPTKVDVGDPITLRMEITGSGNLAGVTAPKLTVDDRRFRVYEAQPVKGEDGPERRVFEQVVIPNVAEVRELPAVRFSFFDPEARAYRTITRGPIAITVESGRAARPQVVEAAPAEEAGRPAVKQPLGRDIVYIHDAPGTFTRRGAPFHRRAWFVFLQLAPVALFACAWAYRRRRERFESDPRLARFRQAGRAAWRSLAALERRPVDARFYDDLAAALAAYLSAKLDLPPGAVDRERVLARLDGAGGAAEVRERIGSFFVLVERARYAPHEVSAAERHTAIELAKAVVTGLERTRRLEARS